MFTINQTYINSVVKKALEEDLKPYGDVTTKLIQSKDKKVKAKIIANKTELLLDWTFVKLLLNLSAKRQFL